MFQGGRRRLQPQGEVPDALENGFHFGRLSEIRTLVGHSLVCGQLTR
jgi:hypothetical protein